LLNFDWEGAENDYKRAIELDPNYLQAHTWYALLLLTPLGRQAEARGQMAYTQAGDPDSVLTTTGIALIDRYAGRYEQSNRILESHGNESAPFEPAVEIVAENYLDEQQSKRALELLKSTPPSSDSVRVRDALLAVVYAKAGEKVKANDALRRTLANLHQGYPLSYETAIIYTAFDDHERALDMLEIAFEEREADLVFLNVDPLLAPLRSEGRFKKLLTQMNLQ
jgi:serine/threonine-protein kinase